MHSLTAVDSTLFRPQSPHFAAAIGDVTRVPKRQLVRGGWAVIDTGEQQVVVEGRLERAFVLRPNASRLNGGKAILGLPFQCQEKVGAVALNRASYRNTPVGSVELWFRLLKFSQRVDTPVPVEAESLNRQFIRTPARDGVHYTGCRLTELC